MDSLDGLVERITYYNAENGYTVLRLDARGRHGADLVTVVARFLKSPPAIAAFAGPVDHQRAVRQTVQSRKMRASAARDDRRAQEISRFRLD